MKEGRRRGRLTAAATYAQWRRLAKEEAAEGKKNKEKAASKPTAGKQTAKGKDEETKEWTVRRNGHHKMEHDDDDAGPGTPTPKRRSGARMPSPPCAPVLSFSASAEVGPSTTNKRSPPSTPQSKRARPRFSYDGNPFAVTPKSQRHSAVISSPGKNAPIPFMSDGGTPKRDRFESPFLHVSTPRQLKALLEASSAARRKKVEDTPRTHARRRLAGEIDSPVKVRKRRGFREGHAAAPGVGTGGEGFESATLGIPEEDEDELGETPLKGEAFAIMEDFAPAKIEKEKVGKRDLFAAFRRPSEDKPVASKAVLETEFEGEVEFEARGKGKGRQTERKMAGDKTGKRKAPEAERLGVGSKKARSSVSPPENANLVPSTPPTDANEDAVIPASPSPAQADLKKRTPRHVQRTRVLELSGDEWDPEASPRTMTITATRRSVITLRRDPLASDDELVEEDIPGSDAEADDEEGGEGGDGHEGGEQPGDPRNLLSMLSLRSPIARAGERMADLRVRALLDPTSAAAIALRAARRGQDVYACGEGVFEEEYLELNAEVEVGVEGDDDWESDPEGWKAAPGEDDW